MMTETKEPETQQKSIHEQFAEATEHKEPGTESFVWNFDEDLKESDFQSQNKSNTDWFNESENSTENNFEQSTKSEQTQTPKHQSTEATKKMSAETAAFLFDEALQLIGIPITNYRFKKKFSDEERERILENDIEDKLLEDLEDYDRVLKRKWNRLLKQRDNKIKAIPLNPDEKDKVEKAFYQYFKVKNIDMPPEWLLGFMLGRIIVDRTLEVALD